MRKKDYGTAVFLRRLKLFKKVLTVQQRKTLKGQALAGDVEGAEKGLQNILKQKQNEAKARFAE